ncbi:MAG: CopG family transcriptional regulator [Methylococcaceae bacterium]|nr:CopG family transcriptional regulator [Methylococcaceae bacterium]
MPRQSISFTSPNNNWLKAQVESEEYCSKSEVVNDLIRKARARQDEVDLIRAKLIKSEQSGFSDRSRGDILAKSKEGLQANGEL